MLNLTIDNVLFEVGGDRVLWSPPSVSGEFVEAPSDWAKLARALVLCDYEDRDDHVYVGESQLYEHFVDTHDDQGNAVAGGRESGLHFPLRAGLPMWARPLRVMTGRLDGQPMVSVLEWDDPLNAVMTAREAEATFGLAESTVKKALQRGYLRGRKSCGTWLVRRRDAESRWG